MSRWKYQYQRVADVLQQRAEQMRPKPHAGHEQYVRDGRCYICTIVAAAPPLTSEQVVRLRQLLPPIEPRAAVKSTKSLQGKRR